MTKHFRFKTALILAAATLAVPSRSFALNTTPDADIALAARVSEIGLNLIDRKKNDPACINACIAALRAAIKLDPTETRYQRLLVQAETDIGDVDGAIAALKGYADLKDDQSAQIELIGLKLSKMEKSDEKVAYAEQMVGENSLAAEVRSAVAVLGARLLTERDQKTRADAMLQQAVRLNPLNTDALRMRYASGFTGDSSYERTQALIGMVQANPLDTPAVAELAEQLSDFGLVKPSLDWYFDAMRLYQRSGVPIPPDFAIDYAAEQYIAEQYDPADGLCIRMLQADPNNVDALFVRVLCAGSNGSASDLQAIKNVARKTLLARVAAACDVTPGAATRPSAQPATDATAAVPMDPATGLASTRPMDAEVDFSIKSLPDIDAALNSLHGVKDSPEKNRLISAISDLAWYSVFFDQQPEMDQSLVDALAKLLPADSPTLIRLQGWSLLAQSKPDEAKVKLTAIADKDPLAQLGLIKSLPALDAEANNRARQILTANPAHILGAFLKAGLRDRGVKIVASDQAQDINTRLDKFPQRWMDVIDKPSDFYLIRGEPLQGEYAYNEPILVRVTIQNLSDFDLVMGTGGVIHTDVWLDAQLKLPSEQMFPGVAYEQIDRQLILRARQTVSQVVRIDRGKLKQFLLADPTSPQQIKVTVLTNPIATSAGVGAGPGGYRVQFGKLVARAGFAVGSDKEVTDLLDSLSADGPGKLPKLDMISAYVQQGRANPADARLSAVSKEMSDKISAMRVDPSPAVRGWAMYLGEMLADPLPRKAQLQEMSRNDDWSTRFLAAAAVSKADDAARADVLAELAKDKDPVVRAFATALTDCAAPATTIPATMPTTMP